MATAIEDAGFEIRDMIAWVYGTGFPKSLDVAKALGKAAADADGATDWDGWGTALKPALEPITVARKPLIGTVADNVLAHGTGAINIGACRVPVDPNADASQMRTMDRGQRVRDTSGQTWGLSKRGGDTPQVVRPDGRWPSNLIHDGDDEVIDTFGNSGGAPAARFFYSPKANKQDRAGSKHPTVKPISLMEYLCRLVTPPGGTVLDPFAGSGTTGQAATLCGFDAILIEREPSYCDDIRRRLRPFLIEGEGKDRSGSSHP